MKNRVLSILLCICVVFVLVSISVNSVRIFAELRGTDAATLTFEAESGESIDSVEEKNMDALADYNIQKEITLSLMIGNTDPETPGWVQDNGNWYYMNEQGFKMTGWHSDIPGWENNWFYFDSATGVMHTGWVQYGGDWYYLGENGAAKVWDSATKVTPEDTTWIETTENSGWYMVNSDATIDSRVTVLGDVHLILADGCTLTVNGGIQVQDNSTEQTSNTNALTVYAQSTGNNMGSLTAQKTAELCAGIGGDDGGSGGNITINGGNITATGSIEGAGIGGGYNGNSGNIIVNGGTVKATGGNYGGAGIGGGDKGSGGNIIINGGNIEAIGSDGAAIGGGSGSATSSGESISGDGGNITINGGTVTAASCQINGDSGDGAGIGGGDRGNGGNITINGGYVKVDNSKGGGGAGIGGGFTPNGPAGCSNYGGGGGNITITGGTVEVESYFGAGIGGGGGNIIGGDGGEVTITGGKVTAISTRGAGIGGGHGGHGDGGDGGEVTITGGTVTATSAQGTGIGGGYGENSGHGNFSTNKDGEVGNAVIFAGSTSGVAISDNSDAKKALWSGVIFEGNSGKVYGTSFALSENLTIESEKTLTIEATQTLTVPEGVTLTNEGTIENNGKFYMDGSLNGRVVSNLYYRLAVNGGTATGSSGIEIHDDKTYGKVGSEILLTPDTPPTGYSFDKWVVLPSSVTVDENNSFTMPSAPLEITAQWKDIEKPVITGLENGKTYCEAIEFEVSNNDGIASVKSDNQVLTAGSNGKYTLVAGLGTVTVVATDNSGNTAEVTVTVNDGHTYEWHDDNGQYWKKCKFCGEETAKKDIPTVTINGADSVCITQDYKFSFTLPEGATDVVYGYEFENKGDSGLPAIIANNELHSVVSAEWYEPSENSFKVYVSAKTADGFEFFVSKIVALESVHTDAEPKDHFCDACGLNLSEHTGGKATCKAKAICEYCGEGYGALDPNRHAVLMHFPAKAATMTAGGNIEYWYCFGCGKYYKDAAATKEIAKADTVIAKLPDDTKSPQTGDNSHVALWVALLFVSGGLLTVLGVYSKKKKHGEN